MQTATRWEQAFESHHGRLTDSAIVSSGQHHRVVNNHVADVDGTCLLLVAGEHIDGALTKDWQPLLREGTPLGRVPRYAQVRHGVFEHNTFVNCREHGIEVGSSYRAGWPQSQRILLPEDNRIAHNVLRQSNGPGALVVTRADTTPPLDVLQFRPNVFEDNTLTGPPANASVVVRPLQAKDVGLTWQ